MMEFDIKEELKKLPKKPGVYIMRDRNDTILYVGKAVNLFNRVRSYFRENIGRGPKIDMMVSLIKRFEYIVTDSELEALVLENNLIKEHRPKYNTMLMDDKTYPYIKVTLGERFPRLLMCRQMKKDKSKYFGPYTSGQAVRDVIDLINKICNLRTCNKNLSEVSEGNVQGRYCLNYHIGQCCGPCQGKVSKEDYDKRVAKAVDFLNGNFGEIVRELKAKMNELSENLEFEEAAKYRDLLKSVEAISEKQKIEDAALDDKDIVGLAIEGDDAVVQVFFVRAGRMVGREHFHMSESEGMENADKHTISEFIKQFYSGTPWIPHEIMVPVEPEDREVIEQWLSDKKGSRVYIRTPKIGQKEKLVELAGKNAKILLEQDKEKIKREELRTIGAVHEVEALLGLTGVSRMEAFDISNTSGFENVASMVVFEDGKPKKSDYRKFKIKTVAGPDDYACMREALTRRFSHGLEEMRDDSSTKKSSFVRFPDLLLMDGGRGQVNIALEVLDELGISVPVAGMVKDDNHRTRGVYFNNKEIDIDIHGEGFKLITRVQDEAHRFAIEYHRSLRTKEQVHSVLDDIPGVGPSRRRALMKAFSSIEEIRSASVDELIEKVGIPINAATAIYEFFHQ